MEPELDETDRAVVVEGEPAEEEVIDPKGDLVDLSSRRKPSFRRHSRSDQTNTLTPTPYTTAIFGKNIKEFENQFKIYNFKLKDLRKVFAAVAARRTISYGF